MNQAQYGDLGAVSSWCFQTITITYGASSSLSLSQAVLLRAALTRSLVTSHRWKDGQRAFLSLSVLAPLALPDPLLPLLQQAQVLDACPGCPYGGLDMSPALFRHFADESVGVIYMSWSAGGGGGGNSNNNDDQKSKEAAAAASSSSAAAAYGASLRLHHVEQAREQLADLRSYCPQPRRSRPPPPHGPRPLRRAPQHGPPRPRARRARRPKRLRPRALRPSRSPRSPRLRLLPRRRTLRCRSPLRRLPRSRGASPSSTRRRAARGSR